MSLLSWLAPPVIGAAIGFITNDIAIRMLFRPLREYRLLGVRVPFTPGIIPRRRHELAQAIGRMVSEELVTADTILGRVREPSARQGIRDWLSQSTAQILDTRLDDIARGARSGSGLGPMIEGLLEGFLGSPHLEGVVRSAVATVFSSLDGASLESLTDSADPARSAARAVARLLYGGEALPWSAETIDAAEALARAAAVPAGQALGRALGAAEARPEVERRARELLQSALEKLNTLQRFFVRAGRYDKRLEEKIPEIVEDGIRQVSGFLADGATQDAVALAVRSALAGRTAGVDSGGSGAQASSRTGALVEPLVDLLASLLRPLFRRPILASVQGVLGEPALDLEAKLCTWIVAAARKPGAARSLMDAIGGAASSAADRGTSLRELLGIDAEAKARLDGWFTDRAIELVEARLPGLLAGLDLGGTVERKIDALDVADVEKLLTMVIARHLKWINVFGALLGALIGLVQVLLGELS